MLLHTSASEPRGFICKISDFGLSIQMASDETHISKAFAGTTSHMVSGFVAGRGNGLKQSGMSHMVGVQWEGRGVGPRGPPATC